MKNVFLPIGANEYKYNFHGGCKLIFESKK